MSAKLQPGSLAMVSVLALAGPSSQALASDCISTSPAEAQAAVEDARRAVLTLEYEPTLAKLEQVRGSLECLTGTLPTESLALLYFYQGLMSQFMEQENKAFEFYQDAAAVAPLLQEDREHGSQVRDLWAKARDEITQETGSLVVPDLPADAIAYVDGRPLESEAQAANVYPGVHLLQVWGDDRQLHGTLMRVRPGETTLVPAEFLASLTPRGELVFDISPRGSHVVVRSGNTVLYDFARVPRRQLVSDVKQGAYIVEVEKRGFYPYSRGKVAVEGGDQTVLSVDLERRPSLNFVTRAGTFWVSSETPDTDPLMSFELIGRNSSGWGVHAEYFHHIQSSDEADGGTPTAYSENNTCPEDGCEPGDGPPYTPNITTVDLPLSSKIYLGVSRQFRVEVVDFSVGGKMALDIFRGSALGEIVMSYSPVPWVGLDLRAAAGPMIHISDLIYDKHVDEDNIDYVRVGLIGTVGGGLRVGF